MLGYIRGVLEYKWGYIRIYKSILDYILLDYILGYKRVS